MSPFRALPTAALGILLAIVVSALCWLGVVLMQHQSPTQTAAAVTLAVNPAIRHYYQNHRGVKSACRLPAAPARFAHGRVRQRFQHCMISGRYRMRPNATPTPLPRPTVRPSATAAPVPFPTFRAPTLIPLPTAAPVPSPTPDCWSDYDRCLLGLLNTERASHGYAPLTLNTKQSAQAQIHSFDMASTGSIWHSNSNFPLESWPAEIVVPYRAAGENVGEAGGPEQSAILYDFTQMLTGPGETWTPGCVGSHHCSIDYPAFSSVGIGLAQAGGLTYVTEDFIG